MYSRNFYSEDAKTPTPPENYSGVALSDDGAPVPEAEESEPTCADRPPHRDDECRDERREPPLFGIFGKDSTVFRLFNGGGIRSLTSGFGLEEMLIIAAALLLLFTKDGDRECAIMLLMLLLI